MNALEALDRIKTAGHNGMRLEYSQDFRTIKQALTPPTANEVCEAMSKYFEVSVGYLMGDFFIGKNDYEVEYLIETVINDVNKEKLIVLHTAFTPHLITLIGRFYKSLESEND